MLKSTDFQGTVDFTVEGGTVLVGEQEDSVAMEMEYTKQLQENIEVTMAEVHRSPSGSMQRRHAREPSVVGANLGRIDNNPRQRPSDRERPLRIDNQRTNFKDFKHVTTPRDVNLDGQVPYDKNPSNMGQMKKPVAVLKPSVYRSTLTHAPLSDPVVPHLEEPIKIKPPQGRGKKTTFANKEAIISVPGYTRKDVDLSNMQAEPTPGKAPLRYYEHKLEVFMRTPLDVVVYFMDKSGVHLKVEYGENVEAGKNFR